MIEIISFSDIQKAYTDGTITAEMLDKIESDMTKSKVLFVHPYTITPPKNSSSRWMTYVKCPDGKRKKLVAKTESELMLMLKKHYFDDDVITLDSLFPKWLSKRNEEGTSSRTLRRNVNDWNKFYSCKRVVSVPLHTLTFEDIESFLYSAIKEHQLTIKAYRNMSFILKDMLKYATRKKLLTENPWSLVEIKLKGCKPAAKRNTSSRVYLCDEKEKLFSVLNQRLSSAPDIRIFAIFLMFKLGIRLGELVALKWQDVDEKEMKIHIHRTETKTVNVANGKSQYVVVDHTKKKSIYGDRFLDLDAYDIKLLHATSLFSTAAPTENDGYIFSNESGRIKSHNIDRYLRRCCDLAGIDAKSSHDIRRTVASDLFNNNVPISIIRDYLGHSDIQTTQGYILDNLDAERKRNAIREALSGNNGLSVLNCTHSA